MPGTIPDPAYYPPSLDLVVGVPPTSTITDIGGGIIQVSYLKADIQVDYWNLIAVNEYFVVNHEKISAGVVIGKTEDATHYLLAVQLNAGEVWDAGDPLVPQAHEYVLHFSNYLLAKGLVRDRDFVLGWVDDDTWGILHQAAPYDPQDAQALHIGPDDDLSSTDDFDVQEIIATSQVLNICRSSDPPDAKPFCSSDDKPPLHINWAQTMTLRAALDTRENARAQ